MAALGQVDTEAAQQVNRAIGRRLRRRRRQLSMTQASLAAGLGVSFQQVQKYETGCNRMSAAQLYRASRVLETSLTYFFADMPNPDRG